ncbi:adenylyl-sulfate kinase [Ensifer adhaerens]|uniref:adenylyl-sulfate kinase n=1 Tax=Ensifer adhaerens TaxID=106592 RepID=UPI001CBBBD47|nr:adenylyl-sulfate kinase [Ensifer adhaerens]MBZ7925834.1 adenylyl-sulfate kinase [Ensifer adhaerens]UAX95004.1 adenylyl-sulfate kinase [Ensifer adhaerens]UAY03105.1 adenylyl-sulfate kinase [Ensifer adhaerens]UAY11090.1 adenylyl-sulfate kinase [Ensifer adhaerens]
MQGRTHLQSGTRHHRVSIQAGTVLWLLGPTSAGKTTLATRVVADLRTAGIPAIVFDGDEVRGFFGTQLGFGPESRLQVVSILAHLANKAAEAGLHVVVAALTAGEDARAYVRKNVINLTTGYVASSIQGCAERDPKGLYGTVLRGEIDTLIGYNSTYRPPANPDFILDTGIYSLDELAARVVATYTRIDGRA